MLRRNYGAIKNELKRVAGATGMNTSDERLLAYVNVATEELMNEGDWPTIIDRLRFKITTSRITLPSDYDRMLYCTVSGIPQQMQSPWFEFVGYGLDLLCSTTSSEAALLSRFEGVLDKDNAATFADIPDDDGLIYYPRVYAETDESAGGVRPVINIQGYDADKNWIRTADGAGGFIDGVNIQINGDAAPFWQQSTQTISYVTAITKPVTKKNVRLYASTLDGLTQVYLGQYSPGDTTPFYRQYSVPGISFPTTTTERSVVARCRRRYVPLTKDADFLLISNLPALKAMMQAVYYGEAKDPDGYVKYKLLAIDILRKEAKAYIGLSNQKPLMTISEGAGERSDGIYIL